MKKAVAFVLMLIMSILFLTACGTNTGNGTDATNEEEVEETFELRLGSIRTDNDPSVPALEEFSKLVEEKSDGTINVTIHTNSTLGGLPDMLSGMTTGVVDMMHDRISSYGILDDAANFNVIAAPFLWDSNEELEDFMASDEVEVWLDEAAENSGVRAFMVKGETEARQLTANRPVETAEDFEGLQVRTAEIAVVQQTMSALGAEPTVIPMNDLYMALSQGTADAQENGFITVANSSFYEVQDYLMQTDYIRDIGAYYVSEDIWNQMSENQQNAMREAASEAAETETELVREEIDETLEYLKSEMTFIEPDMDSIREVIDESVYEQFDEEGRAWATGAYEVVRNFKENN